MHALPQVHHSIPDTCSVLIGKLTHTQQPIIVQIIKQLFVKQARGVPKLLWLAKDY